VILGYVKILKREPSLAEREELQIIEDEVHQCRRIVQELLDLARPPRLEIAPVDLGEIARDTVARLTEAGRLEGITVEGPAEDAPGIVVAADEARIRQVVQNIVVNAVEAGTARITLEARLGDGGGLLVVADEGPGMPPEVQARAFDPFFTTKPRGTGLGLAIAQAIIDAHGGRIEIASRPREGTRVSLWLPVEPATERVR
jgi:signal transduction histidine kinase